MGSSIRHRILVVDDHPIVRAGLMFVAEHEADLEVAGEARTADEALAKLEDGSWDLMILEGGLPGGKGLELIRESRRRWPQLPILVLTARADEEFALKAVTAGAAGYLTKDRSPQEVLQAVRLVLAGQQYVSRSLTVLLIDRLDPARTEADLSVREREFLKLTATGMSCKEIAAALDLSGSTVSTYRIRLLRKLHAHTNADIIRYAVSHGFVEP